MTLCAAWIRRGQGDEGDELVFATDSRLRMGEAWDSGIKLFDLGRDDCLLCFAGSTMRAYPLILQGGNLQRFSVAWANPRLDLLDVLESICNLFTEVCRNINTEGVRGAEPQILVGEDETQFLFGGWSWRKQLFGIWKLYYSPESKAFLHMALHETDSAIKYAFLGDAIAEAERLFQEEFINSGNFVKGTLGLEPLRVLLRLSEDIDYPTIGGSLQVAKVYRSGLHEFFGVKMPNGRTAVLGREVNLYDAPPMRFIDLQVAAFVETLPVEFADIEAYDFGVDTKFVKDCYPNCKLKTTLPEAHRDRLQRILKDRAYTDFILQREEARRKAAEQAESVEEMPVEQVQEITEDVAIEETSSDE